MKKLYHILLFLLLMSCVNWDNVEVGSWEDSIDNLVVSQEFNWQTSSNYTFTISGLPKGVVEITKVDNSDIEFYRGYNDASVSNFVINVNLPKYLNYVWINQREVQLSNNLIAVNWSSLKDVQVDNTLSFIGSEEDQYVELSNGSLITDYPFTLSAWIRSDGFSDDDEDMVIMSVASNSHSNKYYGIYIGEDDDGQAVIRARNSSPKDKTGGADLTDGNWHQVVGVFEAKNSRKLYVDGSLIVTDGRSVNFANQVNAITFGRWGDSSPKSYFNGEMDDFQIWNVALSDTEVVNYYTNAPTGNETGLVGYWDIHESWGDTITDVSSNQYEGFLYGGVSYSSATGGTAGDADGDGVPDDQDDYSQDPDRAFDNLYPATGYGTLAFEDLWPGRGDYDFNDLVVDYQFNSITSASNFVTDVEATFIVRAIGATLQNGFGFQFGGADLEPNDINAISRIDNYVNGVVTTTNTNGTEAGQPKPTIILFENAFDVLNRNNGESGVNTDPQGIFVTPDTIRLTIYFNHGTYTLSDIDISNFNPFVIVSLTRDKEIHLADHLPTALADTSLGVYFGTLHDASNFSGGLYYKTTENLPWGINIYESFDYPIEKTEISAAYLMFNAWATSGGTQYNDWFQDGNGQRNVTLIY